jgi:hypothetical protein
MLPKSNRQGFRAIRNRRVRGDRAGRNRLDRLRTVQGRQMERADQERAVLTIGAALAVALALALAASGCLAPAAPHVSTLVSPDRMYEVRVSGRVTKARFFENWVRAEIYKQGVLHVPERVVYIADFLEPSFQERFGPPEWLSRNVLRLPGSRPVPDAPPDSVVVRNTSSRSYRSVRIETGQDLCLIIDLDAGREQVLPMRVQSTSRRSAWFDVVIDAGTAGEFLRGNDTFDLRRGAGAAYTFVVNISDHGADVAEGDGHTALRR